MSRFSLLDFLPKIISKRQYEDTIRKLTDLQIAILRAEEILTPEVTNDLTYGIRDIVQCLGGKDGVGRYSTKTLNYVMHIKE